MTQMYKNKETPGDAILRRRDLTQSEKIFLRYVKEHSPLKASYLQLSERLGIGIKTALRTRKSLEEKGLIKVKRDGRSSLVYELKKDTPYDKNLSDDFQYMIIQRGEDGSWEDLAGFKTYEELKEKVDEYDPDLPQKALLIFKKQKTRQKTKQLIAQGKIKKRPCEKCGSRQDIQVHHYDYDDPYKIAFLCRRCHRLEHANT